MCKVKYLEVSRIIITACVKEKYPSDHYVNRLVIDFGTMRHQWIKNLQTRPDVKNGVLDYSLLTIHVKPGDVNRVMLLMKCAYAHGELPHELEMEMARQILT